MSIVEQVIDSIKTESNIKELSTSHGDNIKLAKTNIPVKMDLDAIDTKLITEKQTNGSSASTLKDLPVQEKSSKKETNSNNKPESSFESISEAETEKMDVDIPTNGNGIITNEKDTVETVGKNDKETDASGDCKTGTVDENNETKTKTEDETDQDKAEDKLKTVTDRNVEMKEAETKENCKSEEEEKQKAQNEPNKTETLQESKVDNKKSNVKVDKSNVDTEMSESSDDKNDKPLDLKEAESDIKSGKDELNVKENDEKSVDIKVISSTESLKENENNVQDIEMEEKIKESKDSITQNTSENSDSSTHKNKTKKEEKESEANEKISRKASDKDKTTEGEDKTDDTPEVQTKANVTNSTENDSVDSEKVASTAEDVDMKDEKDITENGGQNSKEPTTEDKIPDVSNSKKSNEKNVTEEKCSDVPSTTESPKQANGVLDSPKENNIEVNETLETITENKNITSEIPQRDKKVCDKNNETEGNSKQAPCPAENEDQEMVEPCPENKGKSEKEAPVAGEEPAHESEEDHEMSETPSEKEKVVSQDETITEEDPASRTMCVDENRYFESARIVELSRISWKSSDNKQQYVRGCLWSPDGTCILTAVNTDGMHVINLPTDLYTNESVSANRPLDKLESVFNVKEGGTVYDYCWYPFMNSTMPETCCWVSSRQHCPIQLWDGFTGDLRASYRGYDSVDEVEAAFSVAFTSDAEKVIGGYKKTLKIFDTKSPGRDFTIIPIKQPCSCIAVQETQSDIIATGSWSCAVNLYDLRAPKLGSVATFEEHSGGVTFLKFNASGDSLFSGARKDNNLFEWDMRNFSKPIRRLERTVNTNQRIYFDLSPGEKWLVSGDTDGLVRIWDLKSKENTEDFSFELHRDCCNGVSFHPSRPMLATCSGQYHFGEDTELNGPEQQPREEIYENSLIFWWIGEVADNDDKSKAEEEIVPMAVDTKETHQVEEKMDEKTDA